MPMIEEPTGPDTLRVRSPLRASSPLRTPRAAAVAGIAFSVLLTSALVLLRVSAPLNSAAPGSWLTDSGRRTAVALGLNLVPFAGIAFLWFVGVLRDRIGEREDRFFATVFLGSGLLFVAMMFAGAAIAGGLIADQASHPPGPDTLALGRSVTATLVNTYAMRMAAVFTLTTVTIARHTEIVSRWLTVAGLVSALVLLIGVGFSPWVELLFPAWILALSIDILAAGRSHPLRTPAAE
jgi:MFS family permease